MQEIWKILYAIESYHSSLQPSLQTNIEIKWDKYKKKSDKYDKDYMRLNPTTAHFSLKFGQS